jgi:hypothetical protein
LNIRGLAAYSTYGGMIGSRKIKPDYQKQRTTQHDRIFARGDSFECKETADDHVPKNGYDSDESLRVFPDQIDLALAGRRQVFLLGSGRVRKSPFLIYTHIRKQKSAEQSY